MCTKERTGVDVSALINDWRSKIKDVFMHAMLVYPEEQNLWMQEGGKEGIHTEYLGFILAEMQFLQRAYPGCKW